MEGLSYTIFQLPQGMPYKPGKIIRAAYSRVGFKGAGILKILCPPKGLKGSAREIKWQIQAEYNKNLKP